ncbi:TetR/AcrR family transcriptional regulator [Paeniglutamicibacter psychrophenolicus]|uniref:TetR/AcrR family transcriptional regulator n=1 Tax=Paeniglutamicibacter psychrophenolicus TaxID=257454 RepID=UPI00278A0622|nr:TetR/AcrR family transcriptional regulator C-terminal domain-containing protein [Paeniglutamicibacter psychrophenolicus]MDQ0092223.1 AcrR family transcriptional regulator [Paeniglutamicibacter psychrophenolicus]
MARPGAPKLSACAIAAAALELVDAHGGFTIPALARAMGVGPSSLYNHVASKSDIIELMRGEAMGEIGLPGPGTDWVDTLRRIATGYLRSYARHPRLIPLLTAHTVRDAATLQVCELLADALAAGGFGAEASLAAITVLDSFVLGSALEAGLGSGDRAQRTFEYGLEILLAGFALQAAAKAPAP